MVAWFAAQIHSSSDSTTTPLETVHESHHSICFMNSSVETLRAY